MKQRYTWKHFSVSFLALFSYLFTLHPVTRQYSLHVLIFLVLYFFAIFLFRRQYRDLLIHIFTLIVLFSVGITGWFFSPIFHWLYLLTIAFAFLFSPVVSTAFALVLASVFIPNIGSIDLKLDLLTLISLVLIIPLSYILRREYLKLKENEKKILILEKEIKKDVSQVEEVLANKVIKFSAEMREPVNDMKQLAYFARSQKTTKSKGDTEGKIILLADKTLQLLKMFEENTTGKKLRKNPA